MFNWDLQPMKEQDDDNLNSLEDMDEYNRLLSESLNQLLEKMYQCNAPAERATAVLKTLQQFYAADWTGIVIADLELKTWHPIWWCTSKEMPPEEKIYQFESLEAINRWRSGIKGNRVLYVPDTSVLQEPYPEEYATYKQLKIRSFLAMPLYYDGMGFLVIRNPSKNVERESMLYLLSYIVTSVMTEKASRNANRDVGCSKIISENEVAITVFGSIRIHTPQGVLEEEQIRSPKFCRILVYLLINKRISYSQMQIWDAIWPEETFYKSSSSSNFRGLLHRFHQLFSLISKEKLIESTPSGYHFNPKLTIKTDLEQFDWELRMVHNATNRNKRIEHIKRAISIFKGEIYPPASGEHWLIGASNYYTFRYIRLVNELLKYLAERQEFDAIHYYSTQSLQIVPANVKAFYWLIVVLYRKGAVELAKTELERARKTLDVEEYTDLIRILKNIDGIF